ncbi:hypothetical protein [Pseudomonas koreensis]|uniref:hypothetical protein n=1 Tax=Pseudomonas koreensis TaxID=198620 RepID=UPI002FCB2DFB
MAFRRCSAMTDKATNGQCWPLNQPRFARSYLRLRALRPEGVGSVAVSVVKTLVLGKY